MVAERMGDQYKMCITSVKNFLVKNNVNPELRTRFINYLQLCWFTDKAYAVTNKKKSVLFDLPKHVHQDILTIQRSKYILSIPFAKYLPNEMLKEISSHTRLFYVAPNEILLNTGDMTNEIYVVKQGMCEILDPISEKRTRLLDAKGVFGDIECLLRLPAYYTVRAVTTVRIYSISRKYLNEAINLPKIKDAMNYVKQMPEYQGLLISREPFVKYVAPPPAPNRMFFPLPRKHQTDFFYQQPFDRLGFLSVLRYVFPRFTIRPDGRYLKQYEWFRAFCAILAAFIYPLYSFLELQWPWIELIGWLLDLSAYCDILHRMLVAYFNGNGVLVYHPAITAAHYIRGAFMVDLVGCLPLEALDYVRTTIYLENNAYRQPSTPQYLMYNRLVQLYRVPGALKFLDEYIERKDIILMIKAFPLIISLLTVITSQVLEYSVEKWRPVGGGWRLVVKKDYYGNWMTRNSNGVRYNITESPWSAMLTTFYWVVYETTSTGFNIFQPGCLNVMSTLVTGMLLSMVIITYYAVRVISIRANVNQELANFQENMKDMVMFMKKEKLERKLQREVLAYYEYMWKKMGGTSKRSVLNICDQITLRTDAILDIYGLTFNKCPLLSESDLSLLRVIGRAVDSVCLRQDMTIIEQNDIMSELYIVDYGVVDVHEPNHEYLVVAKLTRGSVFGNLDELPSLRSQNKFVASTNIHLLQVDTMTFYRILQDFPSVKARLNDIRFEEENYIPIIDDISIHKPSTSQILFSAVKTQEKIVNKSTIEYLLYHIMAHRKCIQVYLIIVSMLCVYADIYNAGFKDNRTVLIYTLYALDFCFVLKIVRKMILLKAVDPHDRFWGDLLYSVKKKYFSEEFKYDIASCVPLEFFCILSKTPWEVFPLLRLNRCFRVATLAQQLSTRMNVWKTSNNVKPTLNIANEDVADTAESIDRTVYSCLKQYHENLYINLTMTTVASVSIWFALFVHTSACIWHHIGVTQDMVEPNSSWRFTDDGKLLCHNEYVCSLYFIVTTFTQNGLGDILPRQKTEVAFVSALMILSTIIFLIYVGEFSNIIQYRSFRYYSFYSKYLELQAFLKTNRVAYNLRAIVQRYSLHLWRESRGKQWPYFLDSAPKCLRLHLLSAAYMHHFLSHPIFKDCEPAFLRQLVGHLQLFIYNEDMHVVKEDQITNSMYFIHKGRVIELDEDFDEKGEMYMEGQYFGTEQGLSNDDLPYDISYKTVIKSQVLTLTYGKWAYLLNHFPTSKNIIFNNGEFKTTEAETTLLKRRRSSRKAESLHIYDKDPYIPASISATTRTSYETAEKFEEPGLDAFYTPLNAETETEASSAATSVATSAATSVAASAASPAAVSLSDAESKVTSNAASSAPLTVVAPSSPLLLENASMPYETDDKIPKPSQALRSMSDVALPVASTTLTTIKPATATPSIAVSLLAAPAVVASSVISAIATSLSTAIAAFKEQSNESNVQAKNPNSATALNINEIDNVKQEMVTNERSVMVPMMDVATNTVSEIDSDAYLRRTDVPVSRNASNQISDGLAEEKSLKDIISAAAVSEMTLKLERELAPESFTHELFSTQEPRSKESSQWPLDSRKSHQGLPFDTELELEDLSQKFQQGSRKEETVDMEIDKGSDVNNEKLRFREHNLQLQDDNENLTASVPSEKTRYRREYASNMALKDAEDHVTLKAEESNIQEPSASKRNEKSPERNTSVDKGSQSQSKEKTD